MRGTTIILNFSPVLRVDEKYEKTIYYYCFIIWSNLLSKRGGTQTA